MENHKCSECNSVLYQANDKPSPTKVTGSAALAGFCDDMRSLEIEHFTLVSMNTNLEVIKRDTIAIGGKAYCYVSPREIMRTALLNDASVVAFVHNHPSGNAEPSAEDDSLTRELKSAAKLLGLRAIDHVIVTKNGHYSYAEKGSSKMLANKPHPTTQTALDAVRHFTVRSLRNGYWRVILANGDANAIGTCELASVVLATAFDSAHEAGTIAQEIFRHATYDVSD